MKTKTQHQTSPRKSLRKLNSNLSSSRIGNGAPAATPKVSPRVTAWLAKPKHNLIAGKWVPAASGKTFDVFNPADASVIAQVPDSDREDINQAVAAARQAFDTGPWRRLTPSERGKILWRVGDLILEY